MKEQNTSHAVMNQRIEPKDSLDDFPSPPWSVRALMEHVIIPHIYEESLLNEMTVWEPACNRGCMALALKPYFKKTIQTDIHNYDNAEQIGNHNYIELNKPPFDAKWNAVITNPPFNLAEKFILKTLENKDYKLCAVLVRANFLESVGRWNNLFSKQPPNIFAPFVERVPLVKGRVDPKASTATAYSWLVWYPEYVKNTKVIWIPPCRKSLEKDGDYE